MHQSAKEKRNILDTFLVAMLEAGGSDLHLAANHPPSYRVDGKMTPIPGFEQSIWKRANAARAGMHIIKGSVDDEPELADAWKKFCSDKDWDGAYVVPSEDGALDRFRVNLSWESGSVRIVMRAIPSQIPRLDDLGMPSCLADMTKLKRGLVLVTGPTGSGKSTTLAAMIDLINQRGGKHVISLEDPVEFMHSASSTSIISQRAVGSDVPSFEEGMKHAMRQDPDVILIGEMRDAKTAKIALQAAETGHLVLSTLHTTSVADTVSRVVEMAPSDEQSHVRSMLSSVLHAIVNQDLLPSTRGGRVSAPEVLILDAASRHMIRESREENLGTHISTAGNGSVLKEQSLADLVGKGLVTQEVAIESAKDQKLLEQMLGVSFSSHTVNTDIYSEANNVRQN